MTTFMLKGNLRPKKNTQHAGVTKGGKPFLYHATGSKANWGAFVLQLRAAWKDKPITRDVIVRVAFFRSNKSRVDTSNLVNAFSDILQAAGVVKDDRYLHVWPYPVRYDHENPRVVFWFEDDALWFEMPLEVRKSA